MLILPAQKRWSLRHFPALTLILALVNVLVFFAFQAGEADADAWGESLQFYQSSGLAEIEAPLYERHLREVADNDRQNLLAAHRGDVGILLQLVDSDARFLQRMESGAILARTDPLFVRWSNLRSQLDAISGSGFTERFMLRYRDPAWYQWLTHAFLHGSFGHLFGNMLFLLLIGVLVEPALRPAHFLVAYGCCAIVAGMASALLHTGSVSGMLGASGAIAGLMGMFTTLYGRRRVRFVYWILVYFDYVRAPAIILLPAWLGWELVQWFFVESNVAYEAHAAGLACGALIGWSCRRLGLVDESFLAAQSADAEPAATTVSADAIRQALRTLDVDDAQKMARRRCMQMPDDLESRHLLYQATRFTPERDAYHDAARWLLLQARDTGSLGSTWSDYRKTTSGKIRMTPSQMAILAQRLAAVDQTEARRLVGWLRKKAPQTPELNAAIQSLRKL